MTEAEDDGKAAMRHGRAPWGNLPIPSIDYLARPGVPENIRSEILQAAATTFVELGFVQSSIEDVADTLGSTKGRIYHYYRSKSDIIADIHLESLKTLIARVSEVAARPDLGPAERLYRMCYAHAAVLMTDTAYHKATTMGLTRVLVSLRSKDQDEAMDRVRVLRRQYEQLFLHALEDGAAAGVFRSDKLHMLTKPLLGALNWTNLWSKPKSDADHIHELAHGLAVFCVKAVATPP
jgi:AcrR family transcriptional regulator